MMSDKKDGEAAEEIKLAGRTYGALRENYERALDKIGELEESNRALREKSTRDDRTIEASVQTLEAMDKVNEGLREKLEEADFIFHDYRCKCGYQRCEEIESAGEKWREALRALDEPNDARIQETLQYRRKLLAENRAALEALRALDEKKE